MQQSGEDDQGATEAEKRNDQRKIMLIDEIPDRKLIAANHRSVQGLAEGRGVLQGFVETLTEAVGLRPCSTRRMRVRLTRRDHLGVT